MSTTTSGEFLDVNPSELKFRFELRKQISCCLQLTNKTDNYVAFKVKTTNPKKYCVRPNTGFVAPRSTCDVVVTMQAQSEVADMQCKDKFLLQSVLAIKGASVKDITPEMFSKEAGHHVEECKLRVVYVTPQPTSLPEASEEGGSPKASVSDNGHFTASESVTPLRASVDSQDKSTEAKALVAKLTEERNAAMHQNNKLRQELELLRREASKSHGGVSFMLVILIGLMGLLLGYMMKKA